MIITLNGERADLPDGTSLAGLLARAGLDPQRRGVALAMNGEVVPRRRWTEQPLADGDVVELLTATQGG
jgi:sulfur carrier protein